MSEECYHFTSSQPVAVDFMDNQLREYHPAFSGNMTRYDLKRDAYFPTSDSDTRTTAGGCQAPSKPEQHQVASTTPWDSIFDPAMHMFVQEHPVEPARRAESGYSIRGMSGWDQIFDILKRAQETFEHPAGKRGYVGLSLRKVVDNSQKLSGAVALVPELEGMTSSVLWVVKALLKVG